MEEHFPKCCSNSECQLGGDINLLAPPPQEQSGMCNSLSTMQAQQASAMLVVPALFHFLIVIALLQTWKPPLKP
jgi:hypothetical protein